MANKLKFKRGLAAGIPNGDAAEPLFTTDTYDLYIGKGDGTNQRFQKYIASGATTQILRGDGSLYTFPLAISSPTNGQVLKYNGTSWVNDSDAGITGSGAAGQVAYFTGATTQGGSNSLFWDTANTYLGVGINTPSRKLHIHENSGAVVALQLTNTTSGTSLTDGLIIFGDGTNYILGNYENGYLALSTNATERMRVHAAGGVSIGTTTAAPTNGLLVAGDAGIGGSTSPLVAGSRTLEVTQTGDNFPAINISRTSGVSYTNVTWRLFLASNANLHFRQNSTDRLILDAAGNLGLGVTPSAWGTSGSVAKALQVNNVSLASTDSNGMQLSSNAYWDGTSWRYIASSVSATNYFQGGGSHGWRTATSGTAGNAISFTQAMTLDASGRLLIGVTSGSSELTVRGTTSGYNKNLITWERFSDGAVQGTLGFGKGIENNIYIGTITNHALLFTTNDTERMRLTAGGNVLIGTTTDSGYKLNITGDVNIGSSNGYYFGGSSTAVYRSSNDLRFYVNSGDRMAITSTGNVGIATTSPASTLDVSGTGRFSGSSNTILTLDSSNANGYTAVQINASGTAKALIGYGTYLTTDGGVAIRTAASTPFTISIGSAVPNFTIGSTGAATFSSSATATAFIPTGSSVPTNGMYLPSANTLGFAVNSVQRMTLDSVGRLGLGIASPTTNFHVYQSDGDGISEILIEAAGIANPRLTLKSGSASYESQIYYSTSLNIYNSDDNASRLILTRAGNLGLGVTPSAWSSTFKALQIGLGTSLYNSVFSNSTYLGSNYFYNGTNNVYINSSTATAYGQANGVHQWFIAPSGTAGNTVTFTQAMTLDASGRLGIGTTSPSCVLHTYTSAQNAGLFQSTQSEVNIRFDNSGATSNFFGATGANFYWYSGGAERMRITSGGNVGIGTTTPSVALDVVGAGRFQSTVAGNFASIVLSNLSSANNARNILQFANDFGTIGNLDIFSSTWAASGGGDDVANGFRVLSQGSGGLSLRASSGSVRVYTGSTERMRIDESGNVGIGITSPSQQLEVRGAAGANTTIQITSNNSNDFSSRIYFADNVSQRGFITYSNFSNLLAFGTNSAERMRITSAGELLINTTTDAGDYKLQVAGNAYMTDSVVIGGTSSTTGSLDVYKGVLGVSANARFKVSGDYADAYQFRILGISAGNFNATTYASIDNSGNGYFAGNLGVGVVSPTEKLEVNGNIKTAAPSGGTAKPWKLGEVTGGTGTHNNSIKVEVDGSIYYLMAYVV